MRRRKAKSQTEGEVSPSDSNEIDVPLYVRVRKDLRDMVRQYADSRTEKEVVEKILEAWGKLNEEDRQATFLDQATLQRTADLLALTEWANHRFTRGHWGWAALCYQKLGDLGKSSIELGLFALYREGISFIRLASSLRSEVLESFFSRVPRKVDGASWSKGYSGGLKAVERALWCFREALDQRHNPVIQYNKACALSIKATLACEQALNVAHVDKVAARTDRYEGKDEFRFLRALRDDVQGQKRDLLDRAWRRVIGPDWRKELGNPAIFKPGGGVNVDLIDSLGNEALHCLRKIDSPISENEKQSIVPLYGSAFDRKLSESDLDLEFLWGDSVFRHEIQQWHGDQEEYWLLRSFNALFVEKATNKSK